MVKSLLIITEWGKVADFKNSYYEKMLILFFSYNFLVPEIEWNPMESNQFDV